MLKFVTHYYHNLHKFKKMRQKKIKYTKFPIKAVEKNDRIVMSAAWLKGRRNPRRTWHIKLGDEVIVLSGSDKGAIGKVLAVFPDEAKVLIEGVNIQKRHQKLPGQEQGQITEKPAKIWIWKVSHFVEKEGKKVPTRVKFQDGKRIAVKTGAAID